MTFSRPALNLENKHRAPPTVLGEFTLVPRSTLGIAGGANPREIGCFPCFLLFGESSVVLRTKLLAVRHEEGVLSRFGHLVAEDLLLARDV